MSNFEKFLHYIQSDFVNMFQIPLGENYIYMNFKCRIFSIQLITGHEKKILSCNRLIAVKGNIIIQYSYNYGDTRLIV